MEVCVVLHRTCQDEQGSRDCREESKVMGEGEGDIFAFHGVGVPFGADVARRRQKGWQDWQCWRCFTKPETVQRWGSLDIVGW